MSQATLLSASATGAVCPWEQHRRFQLARVGEVKEAQVNGHVSRYTEEETAARRLASAGKQERPLALGVQVLSVIWAHWVQGIQC